MEILKKIRMCSFPVNISLKTHPQTKVIKATSMGFHRCQMAPKNLLWIVLKGIFIRLMINTCFFSFQYHIEKTCKSFHITLHLKIEKWGIDYFRKGEGGGGAQCVELELRWQFCVHSSTCPEIYLSSKFWNFKHQIPTRTCSKAH